MLLCRMLSLQRRSVKLGQLRGIAVKNLKAKLLSRSGLAALAVMATPVMAQDIPQSAPSDAPEAAPDGEIIVTGSRLRQGIENSAVPLQLLGAEDLQETGTVDLAEAIIELPGVSSSISPQSSNNLIQTSGLSTISLRRLGDDRTLVLINGKRAVSNSGNSDRVSLSTIPEGFIRRVEVTSGGASAVYGSDAIAGVANFILEDNFEGFEFTGRYLTPEASGGEDMRIGFTAAQKFADDRGYVMLGGSYRDFNAIRVDSTRPEALLALEFDDPDVSSNNSFANEINQPGCDPARENKHCLLGSLSQSTPGGVFEGTDAWFRDGRWFNDRSLQPDDRTGTQDFFGDFDGYNFREGLSLQGDRQIFNVGANITYEFSPAVELSILGLYNFIESSTLGGFETLNDSDTFAVRRLDGGGAPVLDENGNFIYDTETIGNMASNHPFIPPEVEETRSGSVDFDRRLVELGQQQRLNNRETFRLIGGLSGDLSDRFSYEVFSTYGKFTQAQTNTGEFNFRKAQNALNIEANGNSGFQCVDAAARAEGCVPLNIFGAGTISQEAADYIRYIGRADQSRTQFTAGGFVRGDLFDIWAGPVQAVFGVEYRYEGQKTDGDSDGDPVGGLDGDPTTDDFDQTSLATFPTIDVSYRVKEAFGEVDFPLIEDKLNLQLAGRVADYNTVGTIFSYNAGVVFRPFDDLRLRAQYSRAQRAPNLTEIFSPPRPDSDSLTDPCEGLLPDGTGIVPLSGTGGDAADLAIVSANCLATGGVQAYFADPENIDPGTGEILAFDGPGTVQGPNAGNPNVQEETADTYTVGAVFTPSFIPNLTLVVDYYRIDIKDAITAISTQDTVDLCYSAADFPNNRFCDVIRRNPVNGSVTEVINFQENLNRELVEGIDAQLLYRFEPGFIPGRFDFDLRYSHYLAQEVEFEGIGGTIVTTSPLGEIGSPNDEFRASVGYRNGGFRLAYTMTYQGGGVDDLETDGDPLDDRYYRVKGQDYHRIYAGYDFGPDDNFRIYGGVNNLFDDYGPFVPTGLDNGSSLNIVSNLNDPAGREFYMGVRARF